MTNEERIKRVKDLTESLNAEKNACENDGIYINLAVREGSVVLMRAWKNIEV